MQNNFFQAALALIFLISCGGGGGGGDAAPVNQNSTPTISERNALVESAISGTEAGLADGCELIYNPAAIDADAGASLCDFNDISIKRFIELRKTALNEELTNNGF